MFKADRTAARRRDQLEAQAGCRYGSHRDGAGRPARRRSAQTQLRLAASPDRSSHRTAARRPPGRASWDSVNMMTPGPVTAWRLVSDPQNQH